MMKRISLSGLLLLATIGAAHAQATSAAVVTTCNTQTYVVGQFYPLTQTAGGVLCDNGGGGGGGSTNATIVAPLGSQISANGVSVTIASDQAAVAVKQATAANLNATVVGTGTFATQDTQAGTWTVQPGNTPNTTPWLVQTVPGTANGLSVSSAIMANSTNTTSVKGSAGLLMNIAGLNNSTAIGYLKIYDSATAPTCGSGTPVMRVMLPGNTNGAGAVVSLGNGIQFNSGIGYCVTGAIADNDTTAVAANQFIINLSYK